MDRGKKITGWLYLLGIRLVIGILFSIYVLLRSLGSVFSLNGDPLTSNFSREVYSIIWVQTIFPFIAIIIILLINLYLAYLFFTKHKGFPIAYIYLGITDMVIVLSLEIVSALSGELVYFSKTFAELFWFIIWSAYLLKSQNVKGTFVNARRKKYVKISAEEYDLIKRNILDKNEDVEA
jgi:hypothetical protein